MMKNKFLYIPCAIILLFICHENIFAQLIYTTQWRGEADLKVYVTDIKAEADLIVYKTEWKSDIRNNDGFWYFTEWKTGSKIIYFTEWKTEADLLVYYTRWRSEAGWVNKKNKKLLDDKK